MNEAAVQQSINQWIKMSTYIMSTTLVPKEHEHIHGMWYFRRSATRFIG